MFDKWLLFWTIVGLAGYVTAGVLVLSGIAAKEALRRRFRKWLGIK